MTPATAGAYPLTGVAKLPNVSIAFPGEHWSDALASGVIVPGEAVVPTFIGDRRYMVRATTEQAGSRQLAIALRIQDVPDINSGPAALGPNEIVNRAIQDGEYVHAWYSGVFHLTLFEPAAYKPGDLITWVDDAVRPTGKGGTGAWSKTGATEDNSLFEVREFRKLATVATEGILTVRSLRGQF